MGTGALSSWDSISTSPALFQVPQVPLVQFLPNMVGFESVTRSYSHSVTALVGRSDMQKPPFAKAQQTQNANKR